MSAARLEARGLVKRYGGLAAVDGASVDLAIGEIHALIGPNGAGKSTLIGLLAGSIRPDAGRIAIDGADVTRRPVHARVALGLVRSFQVTSLFDGWSARDNVAFAVQCRSGSSFRFFRPLSAERGLFVHAEAALEDVGLSGRAGTLARNLSHGDRRRLEIAVALACRPRLVLLDEPLAGLGPSEAQEIVTLVRSLRSRFGVLMVEHDMDAVFALADRVTVLVGGRVTASDTPKMIRSDPAVQQAYLGEGLP